MENDRSCKGRRHRRLSIQAGTHLRGVPEFTEEIGTPRRCVPTRTPDVRHLRPAILPENFSIPSGIIAMWRSRIFTFRRRTIISGITAGPRISIRPSKCRGSNAWPDTESWAIVISITKTNTRDRSPSFPPKFSRNFATPWSLRDVPVSATRRNVVTREVDLNDLIGTKFEVQGVQFEGTEECRPCYWMDQAFAPRRAPIPTADRSARELGRRAAVAARRRRRALPAGPERSRSAGVTAIVQGLPQ